MAATVTLNVEIGGPAHQVTPAAGYEVTLRSLSPGGNAQTVFVVGGTPLVRAVYLNVAGGDYQGEATLVAGPGGAVLASAPPVPITVPSSVTLQGPIGVTASVTFA